MSKHLDKSMVLLLLFAALTTVGYIWFVLQITNALEVIRHFLGRI